MTYSSICTGTFISRPNRFIAHVLVQGREEICHVKNTGRCKELLIEGVTVILEQSHNPSRKTRYDLIGVYKGERLVNIDSQAPNKVFGEWLMTSNFIPGICKCKPEYTHGNSRFDFYVETAYSKILIEVKGVTLENQNILMFPDAPTQRGIKHLRELSAAIEEGYESYVFFIIQMEGGQYFTPNPNIPEFAAELAKARDRGVNVKALDCLVTRDGLSINDFVDVHID